MFGTQPKHRGLFGASRPYGTPGFNPNAPDPTTPQMGQMNTQAPQQPRREKINPIGVFGDFLSGMVGGDANYARGREERYLLAQQSVAAQQMAEATRAAEWSDWQRKYEYERQNPKPVNNDTERDIKLMRQTLSPEEFQLYMQNNYINPSFYTGPDGRRYANPSINRPAVGTVIADPRKGGTAGNGGGGF